jgi:DNA-binding transcriptional ArsR family regulator
METALRALSDPGRRRILTLVRDEEHSAGEIAAEFTVSWPAVSQHLRVLKPFSMNSGTTNSNA